MIASICLLSAVLALALLREVRLRQALERLLKKLLHAWRKFHATNPSEPVQRAADDSGSHNDDRM
jgi:hypothetical protein